MARYNTSFASGTVTTTSTVTTPSEGTLTKFTGSSYTVTIPNPTIFNGITQSFYNAASGTITLSSPSGIFIGPGSSGTSSQTMVTNSSLRLGSDGTNYIILSEEGGPLVATTGTFSSDLQAATNFKIASTAGGTINLTTDVTTGTVNAYTSLTTGTLNIGSAAAGKVSIAFNTTASAANAAALVVTGGVGAASAFFTDLTVTNTINGRASTVSNTGAQAGAGTYYPVFFNGNTTAGFAGNTATALTFVATTGTLTSTIVTASSDERLKENITPLTNALDLVLQLFGVEFNRIGKTEKEIGLIAQQVEKILPQFVHTGEDGMKSVAYGNITALLIEAIKDQQIQINELKGKVK